MVARFEGFDAQSESSLAQPSLSGNNWKFHFGFMAYGLGKLWYCNYLASC